MVTMSNLLRNCQIFLKAAALFYIPIYIRVSISLLPFQDVIISFFYYSHPFGCEVISHIVLVCISLVINDAEHLFLCSLAICTCSLKQCLFRFFGSFKIRLLVFLLVSCKGYFFIVFLYDCRWQFRKLNVYFTT